jgi:hypothetical protein
VAGLQYTPSTYYSVAALRSISHPTGLLLYIICVATQPEDIDGVSFSRMRSLHLPVPLLFDIEVSLSAPRQKGRL